MTLLVRLLQYQLHHSILILKRMADNVFIILYACLSSSHSPVIGVDITETTDPTVEEENALKKSQEEKENAQEEEEEPEDSDDD